MNAELVALRVAAGEPEWLAAFWSALVGWLQDGDRVLPDDDTGIVLRFVRRDDPRTRLDHRHLGLSSTSDDDQPATVRRVLALGGSHLDVGQLPEERHVVLADPEGNEFCVVEADNSFRAGTGRVGALTGDGSRQVSRFWSQVLGWPLVWDQDEETAVQSPHGGPWTDWADRRTATSW